MFHLNGWMERGMPLFSFPSVSSGISTHITTYVSQGWKAPSTDLLSLEVDRSLPKQP